MVIGCPGSGKSTFSRELHKITGIPLFHLDMMYWNADRTIVDTAVFHQRLLDIMKNSKFKKTLIIILVIIVSYPIITTILAGIIYNSIF